MFQSTKTVQEANEPITLRENLFLVSCCSSVWCGAKTNNLHIDYSRVTWPSKPAKISLEEDSKSIGLLLSLHSATSFIHSFQQALSSMMSLEPSPIEETDNMSFMSRISLLITGDFTDGNLVLPSPRSRRRSTKLIMLSRYLKDKQRHEMLACNSCKPVPKKENKSVWKNLNRVLPELAGLGGWCQRN